LTQAAQNILEKKPDPVPFADFIIINIPVWLFVLLALGTGSCIKLFEGNFSIIPFVCIWWCLCGAVMLFHDYLNRKRPLYFRLRVLLQHDSKKTIVHSLKQTPCGYAVYIAAMRYSRAI